MTEPTPDQPGNPMAEAAARAHPCDPANPFLQPLPAGWWTFTTPQMIGLGVGGFTLRVGNGTLTAVLTPDQFDALIANVSAGVASLREQMGGVARPVSGLIVPNGVPDPRLDQALRNGRLN